MNIFKELENKIEKLKDYKIRNLYIWNYFDEIKNKIDISYNKSILSEQNPLAREQLIDHWVKRIDEINQLCENCLSESKPCESNEDIDLNISKIEKKFKSLVKTANKDEENLNKYDFIIKEIDDMIYREETKIGRVLIKKSAFFISAGSNNDIIRPRKIPYDKHEIDLIFPGQLIIFPYVFIGHKEIEIIKKEELIFSKVISYEYILYMEINKFFKNDFYYTSLKIDYSFDEITKLCIGKLFEINGESIFIDDDYTSIDTNALIEFANLKELHIFILENINTNDLNQAIKNLRFLEYLSLALTNYEIDSRIFKNLSSLKEINLVYEIEKIHSDAFKDTLNLENLYLSDNKIKALDSPILDNMIKLKRLRLYSNKLKSINKNLLKSCVNLKRLHLDYNEIIIIESNSLQNCLLMEHITLSSNKLDSIDNLFNHLINLKKLNLSRNNIKKIASDSFKNLLNLKEIDLSCNKIELLEANLFKDLKNLNILNLFENKIRLIQNNVFDGLNSIGKIDLDYNKVEFIDKNAFNFSSTSEKVLILMSEYTDLSVFDGIKGSKNVYLNGIFL